ncbi:hypothetical protein C8R45DRAFT_1008655 [Mycena sanguinolenta]|nr:hypothetical protein C8R45DRAFT_1008655 [Mycena sanguinolenta]
MYRRLRAIPISRAGNGEQLKATLPVRSIAYLDLRRQHAPRLHPSLSFLLVLFRFTASPSLLLSPLPFLLSASVPRSPPAALPHPRPAVRCRGFFVWQDGRCVPPRFRICPPPRRVHTLLCVFLLLLIVPQFVHAPFRPCSLLFPPNPRTTASGRMA